MTQTPSLRSLVDHIFADRRISRETQHQLMALLLNQTQLSGQEQAIVAEVFDALKQGRLHVVD